MNVTAVLVTWWKRDAGRVVEHLKSLNCFDDVIVWRNSPTADVRIFGRYLAALQSRSDWLYTQDDDCLVRDIPGLLSHHAERNPDGLTNYVTAGHRQLYAANYAPVSLVGWGAVFHRRLLGGLSRYLTTYPLDALFLREADRVFTGMVPQEMMQTLTAERDDLPKTYEMHGEAEHWSNLNEIVRRVRQLKE